MSFNLAEQPMDHRRQHLLQRRPNLELAGNTVRARSPSRRAGATRSARRATRLAKEEAGAQIRSADSSQSDGASRYPERTKRVK